MEDHCTVLWPAFTHQCSQPDLTSIGTAIHWDAQQDDGGSHPWMIWDAPAMCVARLQSSDYASTLHKVCIFTFKLKKSIKAPANKVSMSSNSKWFRVPLLESAMAQGLPSMLACLHNHFCCPVTLPSLDLCSFVLKPLLT